MPGTQFEVLSGPPRTRPNREISRRRLRSRNWRTVAAAFGSPRTPFSGLKAILGGLSLARGIPFPRCRSILDEDWSECTGYHTELRALTTVNYTTAAAAYRAAASGLIRVGIPGDRGRGSPGPAPPNRETRASL